MHMGDTSEELLAQHMREVDKFVERTSGSTRNEQMSLKIKSQALKRALAKEIAIKYKESANLFTEFKKDTEYFNIKKWAQRINTGGTGLAMVATDHSTAEVKLPTCGAGLQTAVGLAPT
jgi:hypothetical protein